MSNRPKLPHEYFPTPLSVVNDLIILGILKNVTSVLDPCAGCGNIVKAIRNVGFDHHITAIEIDSDYIEDLAETKPDRLINDDYLKLSTDIIGKFDLVIINPPYTLIEEFITVSINNHTENGGQVIALLRLGHLVGIKRYQLFNIYKPSQIHLISDRPKFTGGPGDIGGHAWVIWDWPIKKDKNINTIINWIPPKKNKIRKEYTSR